MRALDHSAKIRSMCTATPKWPEKKIEQRVVDWSVIDTRAGETEKEPNSEAAY